MSSPRQFGRHYTLIEARKLLPELRLWLAELRLLQRELDRSRERTAPQLAEGRDLGGEVINEQLRNLARFQELAGEFSARELQLKNLDRGLVDFPSLRDGREVFLCWEDGEDDIEFWHDIDTGFAGRERLD